MIVDLSMEAFVNYCSMYVELVQLGTHRCNFVIISFDINFLIIIKFPHLSSIMSLSLRSIFSDISIATHNFIWLVLEWCIYFHPFTLKLSGLYT